MKSRPYCFLLFSLLSLFAGCFTNKYDKHMMSKGYDITKDTLIVKPYEYYKKSKGFTPHMRECEEINPISAAIAIKGYEYKNYVPLSLLNDSIQFVITDTSYQVIESGTLYHYGNGASIFYSLKTTDIKNFKLGFAKKGMRRRTGQSLILFCVKIRKGDELFTIPARQYTLE